MQVAAMTHKGLVRKKNQDRYLVRLDIGLFVVADGMGGHQAGEEASRLAVAALEEWFSREEPGSSEPEQVLTQAVKYANDCVYSSSLRNPDQYGMGTTLTAALFRQGMAFIAHVGDSRAYHLRDGSIKPVTNDHSYVGELVRNGSLTEEEAQHHPQRNVLTRALGTHDQIAIDLVKVPMEKGDFLILCTDGLSNLIDNVEIGQVILGNHTVQRAVEDLVQLALQRGGHDNITLVLIKYGN